MEEISNLVFLLSKKDMYSIPSSNMITSLIAKAINLMARI